MKEETVNCIMMKLLERKSDKNSNNKIIIISFFVDFSNY